MLHTYFFVCSDMRIRCKCNYPKNVGFCKWEAYGLMFASSTKDFGILQTGGLWIHYCQYIFFLCFT